MVDLTGRTVIYGGSFDPPHMGHQMAVMYLLEALNADRVWLVPTYRHPLGKQPLPFPQRRKMCALMAAAFGDRVVVSDVEAQLGGAGRTFDLVHYLQSTHPELSFALAVGADILEETQAWHRWDDICAMLPVVVLGRRGYADASAAESRIHMLAIELPEVSSSSIRDLVAAGGPPGGLLPRAVLNHIENNGLYRPVVADES